MRNAFTLIEILVVTIILGLLAAMTLPALSNSLEITKGKLNEATMKDIKRACMAFQSSVGFMPDNVALLIFPYENCSEQVAEKNFDNDLNSSTCKMMIAFVDSRLTLTSYRKDGEGDYGENMLREPELIKEIQRRLDIKKDGWSGSYIGGNANLLLDNNKTFDNNNANVKNTSYFLSQRDLEIYYQGFEFNATLNDVGMDSSEVDELYPIFSDFNGSRGNGTLVLADAYYDIAKYRKSLLGELTILDPWGTPYEIQFPLSSQSRERFARLISFGPDRRRDINVTAPLPIDEYGDDSVLYLYENNNTNHFYLPKDD